MTEHPFADVIARIGEIIAANERFLIVGHQRPDGDCLGSQLALRHVLEGLCKRAICYNQGPIPESYRFLPGIEAYVSAMPPEAQDVQVTFMLDCSEPERVAEGFKPCGTTVCVDHHVTNRSQADVSYLFARASSTGELIYEIFERLAIPISREIATCLYTAILTDTGSFRYTSATPRAFEVAGRLVAAGAEPAPIASECYESFAPSTLLMQGEILAGLKFECGGRLVWGEITREMYQRAGGEAVEPDNLASLMRGARGAICAILFKQTDKGCRVSFRSKGDFNVAELSERFGGGGHRRAAGADIAGDFDAIKQKVFAEARQRLLA
ncbi:MAG: bifunctional oligoribonuclease/PAP phosphatase NrnA [Candidatus Sumerlaeota bacterium]|nr:bifunctional oligoribonuclease/PAP phosphatase NrnA [Candidatus Sumerlaeota bacterium]